MLDDVIEYNCAVLLTPDGNIVSDIEEIFTNNKIRTYSDKFVYEDTDESIFLRLSGVKMPYGRVRRLLYT